MPNIEISLLYPDKKASENSGKAPNISSEALASLELDYAIDLQNSRLCDMFTVDKDVIEYRQGVFSDLLENEKLSVLLNKLSPIVNDINDLRRLSNESLSSELRI